ncbi:hypothetical protein CANTEDRAFT_135843 [Yamadazyma tenuis ATCC 10573]|uniref:Uncharacterized protein n=1 Tax=Candida tenuis (strain ATCC 10573 / BCRC 21748 / CBS 615 / JCM 9827 / NBRC 10315 / NRRL Y-1498 / VKM Y-70) TaxID=590646 RepID=G3B9L2_CANTC|nr:uncharacterized protein CANTEDRAFT_135843 [Yamadazyma tenuis ATCC 10573]EGV61917.1 hypothetical protein CANTEDRAFT_135843 [Yamadazyma tenuis ATCC 10573]
MSLPEFEKVQSQSSAFKYPGSNWHASSSETSLELGNSVPDIYGKCFNSFGAERMGFLDSEEMLQSISINLDYTTLDILKIHVLRLGMVMMYVCFHYVTWLIGIYSDSTELFTVAKNLITFKLLFHIGKLVTTMKKLITLQVVNIQTNSFNYIIDLIPSSLTLPKSIAIVEYASDYDISVSLRLPKPYLTYDKTWVKPSDEDIQAVLKPREEYFVNQRKFLYYENFRILNNFSRLVVWCGMINVSLINLVSNINYSHLKTMVLSEFKYQFGFLKNCDSRVLSKLVPIIRVVDGPGDYVFDPLDILIETKVVANDITPISTLKPTSDQQEKIEGEGTILPTILEEASEANQKVRGNKDSDWEDDTRRELTINLRHQDTEICQLILLPNTKYIKLQDYKPEVYFKSGVIYRSCRSFSVNLFINSLHQYNKNR